MVVNNLCKSGNHAWHHLDLASRRHCDLHGFAAALAKGLEFQSKPATVIGAHVGRESLCHCTKTSWRLGAVDPDFKRMCHAVDVVPHHHSKVPLRVLDHVGVGVIASGHVGPIQPAHAAHHRARQLLQTHSAVWIAFIHQGGHLLRDFLAIINNDDRAQFVVWSESCEALEPPYPPVHVHRLEVLKGVVLRDVDGFADRSINERSQHLEHLQVGVHIDGLSGLEVVGQVLGIPAHIDVLKVCRIDQPFLQFFGPIRLDHLPLGLKAENRFTPA